MDFKSNSKCECIVECPHCKEYIWIEKLNCRIFRHATYLNGEPIPPHSTQSECEQLLEQKKVYGCTKPFQILETGEVVRCDYI
jgi:hypothetical protein